MPSERTLPKKQPKGARISQGLVALIRSIEESRVLTAEAAQLLCELQVCVSRLPDLR